MIEKFDIYDILGALIPGTIVVLSVPLYFPDVVRLAASMPKFPDPFVVLTLTAICFVSGYTLQAVASLIEPMLSRSWGGDAGSMALDKGLGDRYLPKELGNQIRHRIEKAAGKKMSSRSLFLMAMQRAEVNDSGRVRRFNAMYAYQRVLMVLAIVALALFITSFNGGLASHLSWFQNVVSISCLTLITLLYWHRAKQRGFYFVREVLLRADYSFSISGEVVPIEKCGDPIKETKNGE